MDIPLSTRATVLLALRAKPNYGMGLIEDVSRLTSGKIKLDQGSVYPTLSKLEREGLLEGSVMPRDPGHGGRPKRYFRLTDKGKVEAKEVQAALATIYDLHISTRRAK
jgi:PadR family transcriptional regulator PadR